MVKEKASIKNVASSILLVLYLQDNFQDSIFVD